jgi:hypothetical protein
MGFFPHPPSSCQERTRASLPLNTVTCRHWLSSSPHPLPSLYPSPCLFQPHFLLPTCLPTCSPATAGQQGIVPSSYVQVEEVGRGGGGARGEPNPSVSSSTSSGGTLHCPPPRPHISCSGVRLLLCCSHFPCQCFAFTSPLCAALICTACTASNVVPLLLSP